MPDKTPDNPLETPSGDGGEEKSVASEKTAKDRIWGEQAERIEANLRRLDPVLAELILEVAYGRVLDRPGLDLKTRELLAIAFLMSVGSEAELATHFRGARNCGASFDELRECVLQGAMFLGFPKALAAMKVLRSLEERRSSEP